MKAFRNQPIITKMRIITVTIIAAFSLILLISFLAYWLLFSRRTMENNTERNAYQTANTFDANIRRITENFVTIFGTEEFAIEMTDIITPGSDTVRNRVFVQDELLRLATSGELVTTALMYDTVNDTVYTLFRDAIVPARSRVLWDSELSSLDGISILPERPGPLRGGDTAVPLAFPLVFRYGGATIAKAEKAELIIIVLLSPDEIRTLIGPDATLTQNGMLIFGEEWNPDLYSFSVTLPFSAITLTDYADLRAPLRDLIETAIVAISVSMLATLILGALYSIAIKSYVTSPISKLKKAVIAIEDGNYDVKADFHGRDELGDLRDAMSLMAHTIKEQIQAIKEEQEKQTKTEMRLLTEQLTPHFLYNTLECIQQEIQTGNSRTSSEMTRALSVYLRTVLAYGKETISIKNEIQHEMSYIRIMNGRYRKDIEYQHAESEEIQNEEILKMVLQPFIENSIKHGFGIGDGNTWVQQPLITTSFTLLDGRIRMEISDNGQGFDENHFLSIMRGEEGEGHIGVRNTYLRLIKFYGEENVAVNISSIPYYKSTITIEVPVLKQSAE